jgi:uncharacterized protein YndB with AHSA1/START domain
MIDDVVERGRPSTTMLHLETLLAVAPERVFVAFADADRFRTWFGPAGFTILSLQFDVVEGADYRLVMQPPQGDVFYIRGTFLEVEAPRRLAYTFVYEEPDPDDQETVVTVTFEAADPGTRLTVEHGPFKTAPRWDLHRVGWTETLERLERSLL